MSRLEEIKAQYHLLTRNGYDLGTWDEPFSWLIKQAERVKELEEENAGLHDILAQIEYQEKDKLFGENKRYKQALEDIEDALYSGWQEPNDKALDIIYKMQKGD